MASPQAAGAAALLGQRGQADRRPEPAGPAAPGDQLDAPGSSTDYQAYEQGNGLIDVDAGLEPAAGRTSRRSTSRRRCRSTRCCPGSSRRRASGTGIYDREGVTAGRQLHPARTRSPARPAAAARRRTRLSWVGNDGTFSSAGVDRAAAEQAGHAHRDGATRPRRASTRRSCNLDDPADAGRRVPDDEHRDRGGARSRAANGYSRRPRAARSAATRRCSYFFAVPAGTPAFKVDFTGGERDSGRRPDPVPAVPPVRRGDRRATRRRTATTRRCCPAGRAAPWRRPTSRTTHEPAGRACGRSPSRRGARRTPSRRRSR